MAKKKTDSKSEYNPDRQSIIVCFNLKFQKQIHNGEVTTVARKLGPKAFKPDWLYVHLTSPISAVTARMPILEYGDIPLEKAVDSLFSNEELRDYAGDRFKTLVYYKLGVVEVAISPVSRDQMRKEWGYWPSSSYYPLSDEAKQMIDKCGQFSVAD